MIAPDHAAQGHMTPEELAAWVDQTRADQGLPPQLDHEPTLARLADLMRAPNAGAPNAGAPAA